MKITRFFLVLLMMFFATGALVACNAETDTTTADEDTTVAEEGNEEEVTDEEEEGEEEMADEEEEGEEEMADEGEDGYEPAEFTLVNDTDRPLLEFYVSPPEDEVWGENLIPEDSYIIEGGEVQVTIDDGRPDCAYDIKGVFGPSEDGSVGEGELVQSNVEICDGTTYTYTQGE